MTMSSERPPEGAAAAPPLDEASVTGTVLVVEDEETVRRFAVESLAEAGFDVLQAGDSHDALDILQERPETKVLVTDVRMPGPMNGYRLAQRVRERWPHVEIILVSGYAAPDRRDLAFDCDLLGKPFEAEELVRRVTLRARRIDRRIEESPPA